MIALNWLYFCRLPPETTLPPSMVACFGASFLIKKCAEQAFIKHQRSMLAGDMVTEIPIAFQKYLELEQWLNFFLNNHLRIYKFNMTVQCYQLSVLPDIIYLWDLVLWYAIYNYDSPYKRGNPMPKKVPFEPRVVFFPVKIIIQTCMCLYRIIIIDW